MAMLTWLADVLRGAGLPVFEVPGWRSRGHGQMSDLRGVLAHHTAGTASGNYPSLAVVRDGRPGLAGPLAQLGLARDGTWFVIAAGQAWHAGTGFVSWCGRDNGNAHLIGIEAESTGRGDWTQAQLNAYPRGVAALLKRLGLPVTRAIGHKEWAPGRKIDPAGWPGDMSGFRASVQAALNGNLEDDMPSAQEVANAVWAMMGWHPDRPGGIKMYEQVAFTNHYVNKIPALEAAVAAVKTTVAEIKAAQTAPVPVEIDYERLIAGVVARLGTLKFDAE